MGVEYLKLLVKLADVFEEKMCLFRQLRLSAIHAHFDGKKWLVMSWNGKRTVSFQGIVNQAFYPGPTLGDSKEINRSSRKPKQMQLKIIVWILCICYGLLNCILKHGKIAPKNVVKKESLLSKWQGCSVDCKAFRAHNFPPLFFFHVWALVPELLGEYSE